MLGDRGQENWHKYMIFLVPENMISISIQNKIYIIA